MTSVGVLALGALALVRFAPDGVGLSPRPSSHFQDCATEADMPADGRWTDQLNAGERVCLQLHLERGQFVRISVDAPRALLLTEVSGLAQPFLARPIELATERAAWGTHYDAFLFIRTQAASVTIPQP